MKKIILVLMFIAMPLSGQAQSTVTLDDFDLNAGDSDSSGGSETLSGTQLEMKSCLLDKDTCRNQEFGNAATFSIDDVVNLGIIDREKVAPETISTKDGTSPSAEALPSIDIEILFDYDSSAVRQDQVDKLVNLAGLLKGSEFKKYSYAFFGHTDAKGSEDYNRTLSQARAEAVTALVSRLSKLPADRFVARGLGYSKLKTPAEPFGPANRRVQLVLVPLR